MAKYAEPEHEPPQYEERPSWLESGMYANPENVIVKHLTERQPIEGVVEKDKLKENDHRVFFSGKEKSTAFISNMRTIQVNTCMRMNLSLMESLHLNDLKWAEVWDNIDMMVTTQGQGGNMVKALITKIQEFKDSSRKPAESRLGKLFKKEEQPKVSEAY